MRNTLAVGLLILLTNVPLKVGSRFHSEEDLNFISKKEEKAWVDSTYQKMTEAERLGQLITIRAYSNREEDHTEEVEYLIKKYHVGGITFFQGSPERQAILTNRYQSLAEPVPIMISMDAEWGLGMRMKSSTISYPRQLMLGAIQDNRLIYEFGKEVARQCRRLGVHVNFAPVVDVNNNPNNPVINDRSFGEDRHNVAAKSFMYMKGMQDNGVMACAKHFPGHGDTDVDSHLDLPIIPHEKPRLDSIELYPFKVLAQHGVGSMMIAHLNIPALDDAYRLPSSLSGKIVTDLLRDEIGYEGLIFTDGLEMAGARKSFKGGEVEAQALIAGNDILLLPQSVPAALKAIKEALDEGRLSKKDIEIKVKKVLRAKYRLGLITPQKIEIESLEKDLNRPEAIVLKRQLIENALTVVRNKDHLVPVRQLSNVKYASVSIGEGYKTTFQSTMDDYADIEHLYVGNSISTTRQENMIEDLKDKTAVFVSLHDMSIYASRDFGISSSARRFIEKLAQQTKVILTIFGSPYSLAYFDGIDNVIVAYNDDKITQEVAAQGLFGAFALSGKLPVTASATSKFGDGVPTEDLKRFRRNLPESVGLNSDTLKLIDEIAEEAIRAKATPGCQVLVAKDGQIVYQKAYGYHSYRKRQKAEITDIYDLASVTKICATTISVMKLVDEGKISLDAPLGKYVPELKGSNKEGLILRDVLAHHARLIAWIPFYKATMVGNRRRLRPDPDLYKSSKREDYNLKVADDMYMKDSYAQEVWRQIIDSDLRPNAGYKYSDLGLYLAMRVVEEVSGKSLPDYVSTTFYQPMGLRTPTYNPLDKFGKERIPPTEEDEYFRLQTVQGYVHDMGAAMLNGVSGHAGLFANAYDVAAIMQMLINDGEYGGKRYLSPDVVKAFTTRYPASTRRGIGFDMLELDPDKDANLSKAASSNTFGHLGFTGIATWADPDNDIVFVFLSNRTFPSMDNTRLYKMDIRPRIQDVIYKAMK